MAKLSNKPAFEPTCAYRFIAETERTDKAFKKLEAESKKAKRAGKLEGRIWSYPVADGLAYYLVSKASPLTLQWIPWGDAWQAPHIVIRGLRVSDLT